MAERVQLKVDLEANLGKVVEATKSLKLDKGQTERLEKYRKGALGALPDPELINSLLSIKGDVKGDDADAK